MAMYQGSSNLLLSKFPIIRRQVNTETLNIATSPENESMIVSTSPLSRIVIGESSGTIISKTEYNKILHDKRSAFLKTHYPEIVDEVAKKLQEDAQLLKSCKIDISFRVPELFDRTKVEIMIYEYFRYLGYDVIVEDSSSDVIRITIQ